MSTGYLRIGLDPRIPTVPKNPDFRFRFGRKIWKTEKKPWKFFKKHVTPHFKGNCKQVFVVRMIFIGGNGGKEGAWGKGTVVQGRGYEAIKIWSCDISLKPNCKQVFVVRLIFHKWAWW